MVNLINFTTHTDLKGYTLIIPSVSVGNVPQLTADLIISTHNLKKIGTLWDPAIIPSVGGDSYTSSSTEICTAAELYHSENLKLAVIQLRSGVILKLASKFLADLKQAIVDLQFKNVVILASTFAYEQHNINSGQFRYISNEDVEESMKPLGVLEMEKSEDNRYSLHGAGIASMLQDVLEGSIKSTVLIKYVSEGDNRPDAYSLLDLLYKHVQSLGKEGLATVIQPSSWKYVFGNPPPVGIY